MEKQRDKAAKRQQRKLKKNAHTGGEPGPPLEVAEEEGELSAQPSENTPDV